MNKKASCLAVVALAFFVCGSQGEPPVHKVLLDGREPLFMSMSAAPLSPKEQIAICSRQLEVMKPGKEKLDLILVRAHAYLAEKQYTECRHDFEAVLKSDPDNLSAKICQVTYLIARSERQAAQQKLDALIGSHSDQAQLWYLRCTVLTIEGDYEKAMEAAEEGLKLAKPDLALQCFLYLRKCEILHAQEKDEQCLAVINNAFETSAWHPQLAPDFFRIRGLALLATKRYREAMMNFDSALAIKKDDPGSARGKWLACINLGQYWQACYIADGLLKHDPSQLDYVIACRSHNLVEDYEGASSLVDDGMTKGLGVFALLTEAGVAAEGLSSYSASLRWYDAALAVDKEDITPMHAKSILLSSCPEKSIRDGKTAKKLAQRAVALSRGNGLAELALAQALAECGEFEEALAIATKIDSKTICFPFRERLQKAISAYKKAEPYYEQSLFNKICDRSHE